MALGDLQQVSVLGAGGFGKVTLVQAKGAGGGGYYALKQVRLTTAGLVMARRTPRLVGQTLCNALHSRSHPSLVRSAAVPVTRTPFPLCRR